MQATTLTAMIMMIRMIITTPTAPKIMYIVMVSRPNRVRGPDVTTHVSVIQEA